MNNFFTQHRVNWKTWSPENVIFKSNQLVKKALPPEHILSWKSKGDRDQKNVSTYRSRSNSNKSIWRQPYTYYSRDNYKGIMVQLKDAKDDFPSANIDFIDYTERKDSVGNLKSNLDVLVYLNSFIILGNMLNALKQEIGLEKTQAKLHHCERVIVCAMVDKVMQMLWILMNSMR